MSSIALLGASGSLGHAVADALSQRSTSFRVVGRSEAALRGAFEKYPLASIAPWDLDKPETIRMALTGVDTAIYMVGVNYWQFELHPQLMKKALDGAISAGMKKLLLIGTVYPYGLPQSEPVSEDHPRQPHTFKGRMRKEQEDIVLAAHDSGRIQTAVLRLPDFYGPGVDKSFLWSAFQAAKTGKRAQLIGPYQYASRIRLCARRRRYYLSLDRRTAGMGQGVEPGWRRSHINTRRGGRNLCPGRAQAEVHGCRKDGAAALWAL